MKNKSLVYTCGKFSLDLSKKTHIMGVLNITPDSFSDGGKFFGAAAAVEHALRMVSEGADIIDIGGESTRPGSKFVPPDEEMRRVIPVLKKLVKKIKVPVSVDTYKYEIASEALKEGASIINDISGLHFDLKVAKAVAKHKAGIVLMHIQGTPKDMQVNPVYKDIVREISGYLSEGINTAKRAGIGDGSIMVDPGIGFGKTAEHNLLIFKNLSGFKRLGYPLLIGPSRKSFIGKILDLPVGERIEGTLASVCVSIMKGASVVRVHDVSETSKAAKIVDAIMKA